MGRLLTMIAEFAAALANLHPDQREALVVERRSPVDAHEGARR